MKYFTIKEMCHSNTAQIQGIKNAPTPLIEQHLTEFIEVVLDPLRTAWGSPIRVGSGYRCTALNNAVGGSPSSAHKFGYGADLIPVNGDMRGFKEFVRKWLTDNDIPFDQYIDETKGWNQWVHIGYKNSKGKQRKQLLKFKDGVYSFI